MGQIPNKTYTAPDGSVYRVEADGSITKIKGGRVQSNEPPSKYQISPDGKIYRIEDDGSVTYLGNAEDRQNLLTSDLEANTKKTGHKWGCVIVLVIIIVATAFGIFISNQNYSINNDNYYSNNKQYSSNVESSDESSDQSIEYINQQKNTSSNEVPADGTTLSEEEELSNGVFNPGDIYGEFYGSIDGLGSIQGVWTCGSQMGGGWYCFDSQGEVSGRNLDYINDTPLVWYESIGNGTEYDATGVWYFDYFNGTEYCIATGTYVRSADNKKFKFRLYKQ